MKWYTFTQYVDVETGEIVPCGDKQRFKREWRVINKEKDVKIENLKGEIYYTKYVRKIEEQLKIF